jgi:hypothetical protein
MVTIWFSALVLTTASMYVTAHIQRRLSGASVAAVGLSR